MPHFNNFPLYFQVVCPQKVVAVLKELMRALTPALLRAMYLKQNERVWIGSCDTFACVSEWSITSKCFDPLSPGPKNFRFSSSALPPTCKTFSPHFTVSKNELHPPAPRLNNYENCWGYFRKQTEHARCMQNRASEVRKKKKRL